MNVRAPFVLQMPAVWEGVEGQTILSQITSYLSEVYPPKIIFDLSHVQELTIETVDWLLLCLSEVAEADGEVKLAGASTKVQLILELTQVSDVVEHYSSVEDAIDSWTTVAGADLRQPAESAEQI